MTLTIEDVDRWQPASIRDLQSAAADHGAAAKDTAAVVGTLMDQVRWYSDAGAAARASAAKLTQALQAHARECSALATAAGEAAETVTQVKASLEDAKNYAEEHKLKIDMRTGQVTFELDGLTQDQLRDRQGAKRELIDRLHRMMLKAVEADKELAAAIRAGTGESTTHDLRMGLIDGQTRADIDHRADSDVSAALRGDHDAARRVEHVLGGIELGKELTPEQSSYLAQLQIQQKGKSIDELAAAQRGLGPQGHIVPDSWQLLSNPRVRFTASELNPNSKSPNTSVFGSRELLPDTVQSTLRRDGVGHSLPMDNVQNVSKIADIVAAGDSRLQQGTGLDSALLDWSRNSLAERYRPSLPEGLGIPSIFGPDYGDYAPARDGALADVFTVAGRDHHAVTGLLTGNSGQGFLTDLHQHVWAENNAATPDNQASVRSLLGWIGDNAHSPDAALATQSGQAAHALAVNLDAKHDTYLNPPPLIGPTANAANLNPSLLATDALALAPYQDAIVGDTSGVRGFDVIGNPGDGDVAARNIFAVIDSDPGAAKLFNGEAQEKILAHQQAVAHMAGSGHSGADTPRGDLRSAAYLLGAINGGAEMEATARGLQEDQLNKAVYDAKKQGLDYLFAKVPDVGGIPFSDIPRDTIETGILGVDPKSVKADTIIPTYSPQHAVTALAYEVTSAQHPAVGNPWIPEAFFDRDTGQLLPPDRIGKADLRDYSTALQNYLEKHGFGNLANNFRDYYGDGHG